MSELKVASCFEFEKVLSGKSNKLFYLKSEADKVIAHHKYKRCLTMAMWCWCVKELNRYGDQDYMDFAEKWRKRWLELAEKFKEAK